MTEGLLSTITKLATETSTLPPSLLPSTTRECLTRHIMPPLFYDVVEETRYSRSVPDDAPSQGSGSRGKGKQARPSSQKRTRSSGTRRPFTDACKAFFDAIGGEVTFTLDGRLAEDVVEKRVQFNDRHTNDPQFVARWITMLMHAEGRLWEWAAGPGETVAYEDRTSDPVGAVRPRLVAGGEVAMQSVLLNGICEHANVIVKDGRILIRKPFDTTFYDWAENVASGTADLCIAQREAGERARITTNLLGGILEVVIEIKPGFTTFDFHTLVKRLRLEGRLLFKYGEKIQLGSGDVGVKDELHLGQGVAYVLAQIIEELHANKARCLVLTNYDQFLLFRLDGTDRISVSPVIERVPSPETAPVPSAIPVTPLTLLVALLLPRVDGDGFPDVQVKWAQTEAVASKVERRRAEATGSAPSASIPPGKRRRAGDSGGPAAASSSPAAPAASGRSAGPSSSGGAAAGPGLASEPPSRRHQSAAAPVPPATIDVSVLSNASLVSDCLYKSLHGLEVAEIARFEWLREDADRPITPTAPVLGAVDVANDEPELELEVKAIPVSAGPFDDGRPAWKQEDVAAPGRAGAPPSSPSDRRRGGRGRVTLVSFIAHGRLWDAYRAEYRDDHSNTVHRVVAKIANVGTFDCPDRRDDTGYYLYGSADEADDAIHSEAAAYSGPLAALQGRAVPTCYGLFEGRLRLGPGPPVQYWLLLLEDAGFSIRSFWMLTHDERERVRELYSELHQAGVAHGDVHPRHVLRDKTGKLSLIDFEGATLNASGEVRSEERAEVDALLGR
ncbi:hypothetical protein SCHPADRAFT_946044 [Schizopora paradoxa]|uniref:Protein kinase domain-containing protein n=1 Tax=Schizopora paradoxa TaxID=27342 RepID=A0A0H2R3Y9_9AGAM|nr:hypothetical protein SCHPADRAFT_946044 [Schizopora paradoxa]